MGEIQNEVCTSVTEIDNKLIVALSGEMTDANIASITDDVTTKAYKSNVDGAILNFSMVTVLDSYTFTAFEKITKALALMGVRVIWVGLRPGVVSAMMDLNLEINFKKICTAINLEQGLILLSNSKNKLSKGDYK